MHYDLSFKFLGGGILLQTTNKSLVTVFPVYVVLSLHLFFVVHIFCERKSHYARSPATQNNKLKFWLVQDTQVNILDRNGYALHLDAFTEVKLPLNVFKSQVQNLKGKKNAITVNVRLKFVIHFLLM